MAQAYRMTFLLAGPPAENPAGCQIVSRTGGIGWLEMEVAEVNIDEFRSMAQLAFEMRLLATCSGVRFV